MAPNPPILGLPTETQPLQDEILGTILGFGVLLTPLHILLAGDAQHGLSDGRVCHVGKDRRAIRDDADAREECIRAADVVDESPVDVIVQVAGFDLRFQCFC